MKELILYLELNLIGLSDPVVEFSLEGLNPVASLSAKTQTRSRFGQIKLGRVDIDGVELLAFGGNALEG